MHFIAKKKDKKIIESGNGYLITVKKNQPSLHQAIADKSGTKAEQAYSWTQTGHGHDTQCRLSVCYADEKMKKQWAGLRQYISVRRIGKRDGKQLDTTTYYITSESMSAWRLAQAYRCHRQIENTLHWTKDVVLNEDGCGLTRSQQAANMAIVRDISFNLLVMTGYKSISQGISAMGEKIGTRWETITGSNKKVQLRQVVS